MAKSSCSHVFDHWTRHVHTVMLYHASIRTYVKCSSIATGGGMRGTCPPNPNPAGSWELPKSEEKKIGGGVGSTGSSWSNVYEICISVTKYIFETQHAMYLSTYFKYLYFNYFTTLQANKQNNLGFSRTLPAAHAVWLNTQNCARFGSQISVICCELSGGGAGFVPWTPPGALPLDPAGGTSVPQAPYLQILATPLVKCYNAVQKSLLPTWSISRSAIKKISANVASGLGPNINNVSKLQLQST